MQKQFLFFLLRWLLNGFALWVAASLLSGVDFDPTEAMLTFLFAGLVLTVANVIVRPVLLILSLPAIVFTLGLFMLVVNGVLVWIVGLVVPGLEISFWESIIAGIIVSILNFVFTILVEYDWESSNKRGKR
jgi:putative membrane protein